MKQPTGLQRTLDIVAGRQTDRPPSHPIIMRWAARYGETPYAAFCLEPDRKCAAMIRCARDFSLDWVTVMSDPYVEASAFGLQVDYPEDDLPLERGGRLETLEEVRTWQPVDLLSHSRPQNRIREIEIFHREVGEEFFIVGWVEGSIAEYADLRGPSNAAMDLHDDPEAVEHALDVIVESALPFITRQIEAGAHCIGIGDAFCSQIGPRFYREMAWERERRMVEHIHSHGALAKLHICGNTDRILPDMIRTGADIIDVDHLVPSLAPHAAHLGPGQVFSGKVDPVSVVQNGTEQEVIAAVQQDLRDAGGRCIVSAGCEIPPDTSVAQFSALCRACGTADSV